MSNRLESLNSKKSSSAATVSPVATPVKKFKPKVVNRKSKEERDREAPVQIKQEFERGARGGRGSTRGARGRGGRNNYAGTHLVSSGPLSSGSVSMGDVNGTKLGLTSDRTFNTLSPTPEFLQNLKLKEKKEKTPETIERGEESDDDDTTKINMTQEYKFADEETVLFPVRPHRSDVDQPIGDKVKLESPELVSSRESTATPSREPTVKSEPIEDKLKKIKADKAKLESKIAEATDQFEKDELNKMISDHEQLLAFITDKFDDEVRPEAGLSLDETSALGSAPPSDKYIVFQLPNKLPHYTSESIVKQESEETGLKAASSSLAADIPQLRGQIGQLNIHQSGKITINLGNDNSLLVSRGNATSFLQELVVLELNEKEEEDVEMTEEDGRKVRGSFLRLGEIEEKIIATPIIS